VSAHVASIDGKDMRPTASRVRWYDLATMSGRPARFEWRGGPILLRLGAELLGLRLLSPIAKVMAR
jgi:hypothetical protein